MSKSKPTPVSTTRQHIRDIMDKTQSKLSDNFGSSLWLGNQEHIEALLAANTFYRRNLHRFAIDYLGLKLHLFQLILLYLMGISTSIVCIAARSVSKSFVIAIYACCRAILYPGSRIVLTSGTKGQSRLIVTEKILKELSRMSPNLRREIKACKSSQVEASITFRNGSEIITVTLSDTSRGNRSTCNVYEEARDCDKALMDSVVSPFKIIRNIPFMFLPQYSGDKQFEEEPPDIMISSSTPESHWLYKEAIRARDGMFHNDGSFFIAFDYSLTLKYHIKTKKQLMKDKRKFDPITWAIEYENAVLRNNTKAYFTYEMLHQNQNLRRAFYPRRHEDVIAGVKNPFALPKQAGEIRIVNADIAAVDRSANDNSCFSCLRLFLETTEYGQSQMTEARVQLPYLEAIKGTDVKRQAVRIRQLYEDFEADYIVLDVRNVGKIMPSRRETCGLFARN